MLKTRDCWDFLSSHRGRSVHQLLLIPENLWCIVAVGRIPQEWVDCLKTIAPKQASSNQPLRTRTLEPSKNPCSASRGFGTSCPVPPMFCLVPKVAIAVRGIFDQFATDSKIWTKNPEFHIYSSVKHFRSQNAFLLSAGIIKVKYKIDLLAAWNSVCTDRHSSPTRIKH